MGGGGVEFKPQTQVCLPWHTRNGTENIDQLLTSWLEAEETAQDGSHPQQGQCLARSPTLCLERELDEQGNKGLSA